MEMSCFDMIGAFFVSIFTICAPAAEPTDNAQKPAAQAPALTAEDAGGGTDARGGTGETTRSGADADGVHTDSVVPSDQGGTDESGAPGSDGEGDRPDADGEGGASGGDA